MATSFVLSCRLRGANKVQPENAKKSRSRDRARAMPAPEANAEFQTNIDVCLISFFYHSSLSFNFGASIYIMHFF